MKKEISSIKKLVIVILLSQILFSCYSYRVATHAQGGAEPIKVIGKKLFLGHGAKSAAYFYPYLR